MQDHRVLGGVLVTWELFKQGSMTMKEYSLKFVKISKYATSLVSNRRDEMSRFLIGINGDLEEGCRSAMLHDNTDLSRLLVHVQ